MRIIHQISTILVLLLALPLWASGTELTWQNVDGNSQHLSSYQGAPVIVHFWTSWCPPCRSEMPLLNAWIGEHPKVPVLLISVDEDPEDAVDFLRRNGIKGSINIAKPSALSALGVRGLPSTIIIDQEGNIAARYLGDLQWDDPKVSAKVLAWF